MQKEQRTFSKGERKKETIKLKENNNLETNKKSHKRTNDSNHESTEVLK